MGFRIEAPKQDGNARFNTLKVNLNENNSLTRTVVSDSEGNFYYSTTGGGSGGTNGSSGTSGATGASGSSGTSGTGFNTIYDPLQGRLLVSNGTVNAATASANLFYDTGSSTLQINGGLETNNLLVNTDKFEFTGSLEVQGGITGSLFGTASWAYNALTASSADSFYIRSDKFEFTGSLEVDGGITGSLFGTSSYALTASHALNVVGTASWAYNALTASSADSFYIRSDKFEFTGSLEVDGGITGSLFGTSSYAITASHALNVVGTASWAYNALTASSADDFYIRADKFEFTGSLEVQGGITGSLYGTSSWAVSASWAPSAEQSATASYVSSSNVYGPYGFDSIKTASFALTASSADSFYIRSDKFEFTGSLEAPTITGSLFGTASYAITASHALNVVGTASWAYNALTASSADDFLVRGTLTAQTIVAQVITSSTEYITGSTIFGSQLSNTHQFTGSVSITGSLSANDLNISADKFEFTGSLEVLGGITGSLYGTSSWAVSASWAPSAEQSATASYVSSSNVYGPYGFDSIKTASLALTASSADSFYIRSDKFEFTGSLEVLGGITGSLLGTSSFATTASYALNSIPPFPFSGSAVITGSLLISGSGLSTQFISNANNPLYIYTFNDPSNPVYGRLRFYYDSLRHRITSEGAGGATRDLGLMGGGAGGQTYLGTSGTDRWFLTGTYNALGAGHFLPIGDGLYNIGDPTAKVANYYGIANYISNLLVVTGSVNITGSVTSSGDIIPGITDTYNLGSATKKWKDLYLSGSTIYLGNTEIKEIDYKVTALYGFSGSFTGSLFGTSSFTTNAATASSADSFYIRSDKFEFTGSLEAPTITGSLFGTSSWAIRALTASYIDPGNIPGIATFRISTGSVSASVNVTPENLFLINSGFTQYFNISSSGDTDIYSNLFIIRNFDTKQPVLTVSQSIVQIATHSIDPTGNTQAGSIWFTPYTMYVGLEDDTYIIPN